MYMHDIWRAAAAATLALFGFACDAAPSKDMLFGFGADASAEDLRKVDIDVRSDGIGLPKGAGTHAQGRILYETKCKSCHSDIAKNDVPWMPAWVGSEPGSISGHYPYATTLFDYIRRAMPMDRPGSLTDDEVYSALAFILGEGGVFEKSAELNAQTILKVKMPNEKNFVPQWPPQKLPQQHERKSAR
jgi:cytochrome c